MVSPKSHDDLIRTFPEVSASLGFLGFPPPTSNTTYTPNQFFDTVLPHSSLGCVRLVSYLLRKTLGWVNQSGLPQDEQILVSYSDLTARAGISRALIKPAIEEAIAANFINCVRQGRSKSLNTVSISPLYELRWDEKGDYLSNPSGFQGFYAQEGNRTYIPNAFLDQVVPREKLSVVKVVGAIIRNTIGWSFRAGHRRQEVALSFTDLQRRTRIADRNTISLAIQHALASNYIVKVSEGFFDPNAGQTSRAATYAIRWLDSGPISVIGSKTLPGKIGVDRFKSHTGNGSKTLPEDRFRNPTDIKIKQGNKTLKAQQHRTATPTLDAAQSEIYVRLRKEGFDGRTAEQLASTYPAKRIEDQLGWLAAREPSRNRLGMLRKSIEEKWPEPNHQNVRTLTTAHSVGRLFVAHFYAGFHGNRDTPIANASMSEAVAAEEYVQRLLAICPAHENVGEWGRQFGELFREKQRPYEAGFISFTLALRRFGDEFYLQNREKRDREIEAANAKAREVHHELFQTSWLYYLAREEERIRKQRAGDYGAFEEQREAERNRIASNSWQFKREETLAHFDSAAHRLKAFQEFFADEVLSFWDWDTQLNPRRFTNEPITP